MFKYKMMAVDKTWKFLIVLAAFTLVLGVPAMSQDSGYDVATGEDAFDQQEWSDLPNYVENLEAEVVFSDTIQRQRSAERCSSYVNRTYENRTEYTECNATETYFYGGDSTYLFDLKNIETRYLGNGEIYLAFTASPNDLTKKLHLTNKNPNRNKSDYVDWFNSNYLYNGENLTVEEFDDFKSLAENVNSSSLEGRVRGKRVVNSNLMSGSGRYEFVVRLKDFRNGAVALNDAVGVRLKSSIYRGGGEEF